MLTAPRVIPSGSPITSDDYEDLSTGDAVWDSDVDPFDDPATEGDEWDADDEC